MADGVSAILVELCDRFAGLIGEPVTADERLFSSGRLDSVRLMTILGWAEIQYGVEVDPADLSLANFDTPRRFAEYLARHLAEGPGQPTPR
ncbi:MAG: acyl carrier protein [Sporichthyaceae bacterium]|nr:acyl carrier protein [Sporichthyaceae bacterium]